MGLTHITITVTAEEADRLAKKLLVGSDRSVTEILDPVVAIGTLFEVAAKAYGESRYAAPIFESEAAHNERLENKAAGREPFPWE